MNGYVRAQRITRLRNLKADREHLYDKLGRIGFVPDKDMRKQLEEIRSLLGCRIDRDRKELEKLECETLEEIVK